MFLIEQPDFVRNVELPSAFELTVFSTSAVKSFSNYLNRIHQSGIPFAVISINSSGGDADCLSAFISLIDNYRQKGLKFCTVVPGFAYSAGAFIFLLGDPDYRFIGSNGTLMLHQVQLFQQSDRLSSVKNNTDVTKAQQESLFQVMSKHLKKKPDWLSKQILAKNNEDWYISAKEAESLGFAKIGLPEFRVRISAEFSIE